MPAWAYALIEYRPEKSGLFFMLICAHMGAFLCKKLEELKNEETEY